MNDSRTELENPDLPFIGTVAIVGRPNVGKSSLFNRIAGRQISIVHDQPGVTRDRVSTRCRHDLGEFDLIDTGGIGSMVDCAFDDAVRMEAEIAITTADFILFVVSGPDGLTPTDSDLAAILRRSGKPVALAVNKIDTAAREPMIGEFQRTGFRRIAGVSAAHGAGVRALVDSIAQELSESGGGASVPTGWETAPRIALVGRPNVGKSSLLNALTRSRRSIVSEIAGTTRDTVDTAFTYGGEHYILVDTAGIRPRSRHNTSVEVFSVMRAERAIRRSDLCLLVIDAPAGITAQDKKIAGLIQKAGKPCVIVFNKWDVLAADADNKEAKRQVRERIDRDLFFLDFAPAVFLSAKTGLHLGRVFKSVLAVREASRKRTGTGQLNRLLSEVLAAHPPPLRGGRRFKILYATQIRDRSPIPVPRFVFFVNNPDLLSADYRRYLETKIRQTIPYTGLPLAITFRGRAKDSGK